MDRSFWNLGKNTSNIVPLTEGSAGHLPEAVSAHQKVVPNNSMDSNMDMLEGPTTMHPIRPTLD